MTESKNLHALVFGASGLVGWGVTEQLLLNYPNPETFGKVTALVNRPLEVEDSCWPKSDKLQLVSGVDLTKGSVNEFARSLKERVTGIEKVTHVYYLAYKSERVHEIEVNVGMLDRVIGALEILSPDLQFVVFPSGSKAYGITMSPPRPFTAPFKESVGRLPPARTNDSWDNWYYRFQDLLAERSAGKSWSWCDIRPDLVVGFAPNGSAYSLVGYWANYLAVYRQVEGKGAKVAFPGSKAGYDSLFNDVSSGVIARAAIWASLNPDKTSGEIFNVANSATPSSMRERWPRIAAWFGLVGVGPENLKLDALAPRTYVEKHGKGIKLMEISGAEFLDYYGYHLDFDRHFDLEKIKKAGFQEDRDGHESWIEAFERYKAAGFLSDTGGG
ncbi:hypothetical protein C8J56DRAFT_1016255 [Mycena floridula]|nr:hypothetical protein C8J56DRAFT_1016255 [Mycena floridula]